MRAARRKIPGRPGVAFALAIGFAWAAAGPAEAGPPGRRGAALRERSALAVRQRVAAAGWQGLGWLEWLTAVWDADEDPPDPPPPPPPPTDPPPADPSDKQGHTIDPDGG